MYVWREMHHWFCNFVVWLQSSFYISIWFTNAPGISIRGLNCQWSCVKYCFLPGQSLHHWKMLPKNPSVQYRTWKNSILYLSTSILPNLLNGEGTLPLIPFHGILYIFSPLQKSLLSPWSPPVENIYSKNKISGYLFKWQSSSLHPTRRMYVPPA